MSGISLKAVRANADMTKKAWAQALGVSVQTVTNWESGNSEPSASMLRKISEKSGVDMDFIFVPEKTKNIGL